MPKILKITIFLFRLIINKLLDLSHKFLKNHCALKIFMLLIVCCCQLAVYSQNYTLSAVVKSTKNEVLPFASVSIKGTTDGTSTDENGFFT